MGWYELWNLHHSHAHELISSGRGKMSRHSSLSRILDPICIVFKTVTLLSSVFIVS